jgi:hypothetical protein
MSVSNSSEHKQEVTPIRNEVLDYTISKARITGELVVIKVLKTNKKIAKYDEASGKDVAPIIYGQVVAINPKNKFNIKCGAHVIYDGLIRYVVIENSDEYVIGTVNDIIIIWDQNLTRTDQP